MKDALTGALSRAALQSRFAEEVQRCRQNGGLMALAVFDVDHFKSINDAFGHQRGDQVLVDCVRRLEGVLRTTDQVFRYGGDEFVILMPGATREQALAAAGRLIEYVRAVPFPGEPPVAATISVGIAAFPADGMTPEDLFASADARLYMAKRTGRSRAVADDAFTLTDPARLGASRMIEREGGLAGFRSFLDALPGQRGTFAVVGPRGSGRSRFLTEAATIAQLRGFRVLTLEASAALKARAYGALVESLGAQSAAMAEEELLHTLSALSGGTGIILFVDNLTELDPSTLQVISRLFASGSLGASALVYSTEPEHAELKASVEAGLQHMVHLAPLTPGGLQIWLRGSLQSEPSADFVTWLYRQTHGLPGLVESGLAELREQGVLHAENGVWTINPTYVDAELGHASSEHAKTRLPAPLSSFVGRERELHEVKRLLEAHRLVTLLGPGGAGKTRLAEQAASELVARYRHGVSLAQLAPVLTPEALPGALVETLGLTITDRSGPREKLLQYLQHKQMLLVLDNFEHLVDGAGLVQQLLEAAPHLSVLVTSRERLHLPAEALLEVTGLPFPDAAVPAQGHPSAAVQLFLDRSLPLTGAAEWPPAEMVGVVRICQLVQGMPLAIELAAAWVRLLSCAEIAEGIAKSLDFLAPGQAVMPARHRSLRAVFEHSWHLLSPEEQQVYGRLSVFRGGFDLKAAAQVAGASLFMLSALLDKSLIRRTTAGRFEVHELLRQFGAEALGADAAATERRHAGYYLGLAEEAAGEMESPRQIEMCNRLSAELPNIRAALQWALAEGDADVALRLCGGLFRFWEMRGLESEGRRWTAAALALPGAQGRTALRAGALGAAEHMARRQGDIAQSKSHLEEALAVWQELGNPVRIAESLEGLGFVTLMSGDPTAAEAHVQESLRLLRPGGPSGSLHRSLNTLGQAYQVQGRFAECMQVWEESLGIGRTIGNAHGIVSVLNNLAVVTTSRGEYDRAVPFLEECLERAPELGIKQLTTAVLGNLGVIALIRSDFDAAASHLQEALTLARQIESKLYVSICFGDLGILSRRRGDLTLAAARHAESLSIARAIGYPRSVAYYLLGMAAVHAGGGRAELAARVLGAGEAYLESTRNVADLVYRQEVEYVVATAGAELGEAGFEAARAEGRAVPLEEALTLALTVA